ncbi:MAG: TetR/AcrR family transcriptional regulator [Myxococcaceae bacterium]
MKATSGVRPDLLAGQDLPPIPRQTRSQEKRARLKAAGLVLFGDKGYEATAIEDITRRADLAIGGFYQHFRSKRQLLLALMNELLDNLSEFGLRPTGSTDVRAEVRGVLARAFSTDAHYFGAYRAWREAMLSDSELAVKDDAIRAWTTYRVTNAFAALQRLPGARSAVDVPGLARAMDSLFWNLLAQVGRLSRMELNRSIDSATHLIYHALFSDGPRASDEVDVAVSRRRLSGKHHRASKPG